MNIIQRFRIWRFRRRLSRVTRNYKQGYAYGRAQLQEGYVPDHLLDLLGPYGINTAFDHGVADAIRDWDNQRDEIG